MRRRSDNIVRGAVNHIGSCDVGDCEGNRPVQKCGCGRDYRIAGTRDARQTVVGERTGKVAGNRRAVDVQPGRITHVNCRTGFVSGT